jgi:miniconductance mechanosensitive channel
MTDYLQLHPLVLASSLLILLLAFSWIAFFICRALFVRGILYATRNVANIWAQVLLDKKLLFQISWFLPLQIIYLGLPIIPELPVAAVIFLQRAVLTLLVLVCLRSISLTLRGCELAYASLMVAKQRPIKGLIQVVLIVVYLISIILIASILLDKSPLVFLSGLGAMTAVLLLVFRDTILSFVAGFQLTTNNLISVGDWIEMPQFGADGDVIDIALHTVKVQNWDLTITVIPTHRFLENSFKNWRGMQEAGGRRIKRSINIDLGSIKFLSAEEIARFKNFVLLNEYVESKERELTEHNKQFADNPEAIINSRRLTNIGTFRAYLIRYLRSHPGIRQDMTFLVRQLAPTAQGLPLEVYIFTKTTVWAEYEDIQANIFDHILAIAAEFGLCLFQEPSGKDFARSFSKA